MSNVGIGEIVVRIGETDGRTSFYFVSVIQVSHILSCAKQSIRVCASMASYFLDEVAEV